MAFLEVGIIEIAVLQYKRLEDRYMLNLKIATNLNKLDVYAISDFKSLQQMQWIGLLKQVVEI
jgi:hypothetical protein